MAQYSKVGNVEKMFNQNFSIVTTNASANDMLNFEQNADESFINSSLIIASPGNDDGVDHGTPSLLVTDYEGHAMRLTYTIKPGNGLVLGYTYASGMSDSLDTLSLAIDNDSLKTTKFGNLYVDATGLTEKSKYLTVSGENNVDLNLDSIPDNKRIKIFEDSAGQRRLGIDAEQLIDNITLKTNMPGGMAVADGFASQRISVNLDNIVDGASITTASKNGKRVLKVNTDFLTIATTTKPGIVKVDGSTIKINGNKQIYVDSKSLKAVTGKGGTGVVTIPAQGVGDLYVDNSGVLRVNPYFMPKCSTEDSSKENRGFGVCAVDGITIKASQNGVLSVVSKALDNASSTKNGVVRPDNSTIKIQPSGVIYVDTQKLTQGSAAEAGIVKYDNKSITKNTQGQLTVTNASKWDSDIADILTKISGYNSQIAALESKLVEFMATITTKTSIPFTVTCNNGVDLKTISVHVPNLTAKTTGVYDWDMSTLNKLFTINYGAGYVFRFSISSANSASWLVGAKLRVNNVVYSQNSDIKLSTNSATAQLIWSIQGYGTQKTERPEGVFNITFSDGNGQPLKIITLYIHSCLTVRTSSGFRVTLNGAPYSSTSASITTNSTKLSTLINTIQPQPAVGTRLPQINTGIILAGGSIVTSCIYRR